MKSFIEAHKKIWTKEFTRSVVGGVFLFIISLVLNFYATRYAARRVSLPVTDLIISNIRVYDVDGIIIYGALVLMLLASVVTLFDPKRIPFVLKSVALFIITRSVFISLTHIGPSLPQDTIDPTRILNALGISSTADLFFSGHTGVPFLLALIYWDSKILRLIFLATSVTFAVAVLLAHLHYSIDVFAAFFITYTIFHIAQYLFKKDWQLSVS
jgi:membrane-associated phospholipid phosphatase